MMSRDFLVVVMDIEAFFDVTFPGHVFGDVVTVGDMCTIAKRYVNVNEVGCIQEEKRACFGCDYKLRGLSMTGDCPECGLVFDYTQAGVEEMTIQVIARTIGMVREKIKRSSRLSGHLGIR
ncbi:hypothetical protein JD969_16080 [Planctomycetota bacterium]|nr:hypothetical protein JD969_16080 [Planctomycetota bacterium]